MSTADTSPLNIGLYDSSSQMNIIPESSFFKEKRGSALPTPAEVRAINKALGGIDSTDFNRPPPVRIPSLGLFVKYGGDVTVIEAQTQNMVHECLHGQVPIPEVFGWTKDEDQVFIYMALIDGETLQDRWSSMDEGEIRDVCGELRNMVNMWRTLEQSGPHRYIGSINKKPLNDIFLKPEAYPERAGPFEGEDAVQQLQDACGIYVTLETPIVFTHDDLVPPNIILTRGPNPKVAAIVDWNQAGWYPSYWEYCKSREVGVNPIFFGEAMREEWCLKYLPMILDPVDEEAIYHNFLYFVLSRGI